VTLPVSINDLEKEKFRDGGALGTRVAITTDGEPLDANFAPSGLRIRLKISNIAITDSASPIPAIALADRNSIIIQNKDPLETLFIGESDVEASGASEGWEVAPTSFFSTDIKNNIVLYGIAPTGKTINIKVMELA